jgi:hypothetical protein
MKKLLVFVFVVTALVCCKEPTDQEKCEIVTDELCYVLDRCADINRQECDVFHDEAYCEQVEVGDNWEECYDDLYYMTCEDDYPPASCNEAMSIADE